VFGTSPTTAGASHATHRPSRDTIPSPTMSEPFPLLNTSVDQLHNSDASNAQPKRRHRKSSALGTTDIRAGDTAPAMASSRASLDAGDDSVRSPIAGTALRNADNV
jgi:hypothetical protein